MIKSLQGKLRRTAIRRDAAVIPRHRRDAYATIGSASCRPEHDDDSNFGPRSWPMPRVMVERPEAYRKAARPAGFERPAPCCSS